MSRRHRYQVSRRVPADLHRTISSVDPMSVTSDRIFLTAEWRNLAMLNYEVDAGLLLPFVPAGTELDRWNGKVFVSLLDFVSSKPRCSVSQFRFIRILMK